MKLSALLMSIVLLLVLVSAPEPQQPLPRAEAAIFTVTNLNDSGTGSLRQAILDANGSAGPDVINFDASIAGGMISLITQLEVTDDVTINGSSGITLDGNNTTRIVEVTSATTVTINDLTFQNGSAFDGGAIYHESGTLVITNGTFIGNQATSGDGGAIFSGGTVTITNSTFDGNTADRNGGAIFDTVWNTVIITNSTFDGNTSDDNGGAIFSWDSTVEITGSTFTGNMSLTSGGAIIASGMVEITNSTFSNNQVLLGPGGAIFSGGALTITNSTFSGNQADGILGQGGAIFSGGALTITSSTFSGNTATDGGTFYRDSSTINVGSSIIVGGSCVGGGFADQGNNLRFNATGCPGTVANPQLGPLQNNGGPTHTMLPALTSPAVDAYAAPCATATDQRGISRPQGSQCDIGATEHSSIVVALVASAACNGPNLAVNISAGDGPFNITASAGINTPVNGVSVGTTTINGPEKWDNLTVTETTGDTESINLGTFKCRTDERPVPISPAHQSRTTNPFPTFSWTAITIANNYRVFVFDSASAATRTVDIRQNSGGPTSMTLSVPLPDGRLFWRVRGRQNRVWSLWSVRFTLFKDPVVPFSVSTPVPTIDLNLTSGDGSAPSSAPTFPAPPNSR